MKHLSSTVTIEGNLAADPELRYTPGGNPVASITVLVNNRRKDGERWVDAEPTRHDCTVWGEPAENVANSLARGDRVLVVGEVTTDTWNDETSGEKRTRDKVTVTAIGASLRYHTTRPVKAERVTTREDTPAPTTEDEWATEPAF
jgi:single-strand DNA-binding protein